jgi:hypothetical protein
VRPRDAYSARGVEKAAQSQPAPYRPDTFSPRRDKFLVIVIDRAAVYQELRLKCFDVIRRVPVRAGDTRPFEFRLNVSPDEVAPVHPETHAGQNQSESAHSHAPDTHEVDPFHAFKFAEPLNCFHF